MHRLGPDRLHTTLSCSSTAHGNLCSTTLLTQPLCSLAVLCSLIAAPEYRHKSNSNYVLQFVRAPCARFITAQFHQAVDI